MNSRPFQQVDVFTAAPYLGRPLAVVLDGTGLSAAEMQHFARWSQLPATAFLLPPSADGAAAGADYRVRLFAPEGELPFAVHATLGSCHAWLQAGGRPRQPDDIVQEGPGGLVRIHRAGVRLALAAPPLPRQAPSPALLTEVTAALCLAAGQLVAAQWLDSNPRWLVLLLDNRSTLQQLAPDIQALQQLGHNLALARLETAAPALPLIARSNREARAFGPRLAAPPEDATLEVRAFAAPCGSPDAPASGRLHAGLAQWLMTEGLAPSRYLASQGSCCLQLAQDEHGQVWVGGEAVTCIDGSVRL